MGSPILTFSGHGQSKSLFLQPRHSHFMHKPTPRPITEEGYWNEGRLTGTALAFCLSIVPRFLVPSDMIVR